MARFPHDGHGPRDLFSGCSSRCASHSPKEHTSRPLSQDRLFVPLLSKTISKKNKGTSGLSGILETRARPLPARWFKRARALKTRGPHGAARWPQSRYGGGRSRRDKEGAGKRAKEQTHKYFLRTRATRREKTLQQQGRKQDALNIKREKKKTNNQPSDSIAVFLQEQNQDKNPQKKKKSKRDGSGVRSSGGSGSPRQALCRVDALHAGPVPPGRRHQHGL